MFTLDQETMCSIDELRSLAKSGPVNLKLPVQVWSHKIVDDVFSGNSSFYRTLLLALAELELDLELARLAGPAELPAHFSNYEVTIRSPARPIRPPGLSVLPPFAVVPYSSPEILVAPYCPANLRHPVGAWFADRAAMLSADYPALFAQFRRALAMISNVAYLWDDDEREAVSAVNLLNAVLDRIRRSVPDVPSALSQEIYADEDGRLRSR